MMDFFRNNTTRHGRRRGLTLLEVLIAATLMAALLVALWRLIGIYTMMREKGDVHAERVGSVSVMMQQLEDDLRNLPDTPPTETPQVDALAANADRALDIASAPQTPDAKAPHSNTAGGRSAAGESRDAPATPSDAPSRFGGDDPARFAGRAVGESRNANSELTAAASADARAARDFAEVEGLASPSAPSCLYGDDTSLTLTHLDSDASRNAALASDRASSGGGESSRASQPNEDYAEQSVHADSVQLSTRLVRYWLAGAMPLAVASGAGEFDAMPDDPMALGATEIDDPETTDESKGLFREEVICISTPSSSIHLRTNRRALGPDEPFDLADDADSDSARAVSRTTEVEESEEVARQSFRLGAVEWAKFRYYDGSAWRSSWDSRTTGRLPVAIEMSLWLARRDSKKADASADAATGAEWTALDAEGSEFISAQNPMGVSSDMGYFSQSNAETDGAQENTPMERQPEVRQLVILRAPRAEVRTVPGLTRTPLTTLPRRALRPADAAP